MVIDVVDDTQIPRYLIYDIIKFRGEEVGKMDFRIRLNCIRVIMRTLFSLLFNVILCS